MGYWGDYDCGGSFCMGGGCSRCDYGKRQEYHCDRCTDCKQCIESSDNKDCQHNTIYKNSKCLCKTQK